MVEVGAGEIVFGSPKLDVTLLADIEQLAAVEVRAAPGWGRTPLHVHARHAESAYVFDGEVTLALEDRAHVIGPETWAFVPPGIAHAFEVTGGRPARFLVMHTPGSGYGDYVRGTTTTFDQLSPLDVVARDPGLVVIRRTDGSEGEQVTDRPERRATVLVESEEIAVLEYRYGAGERGAPLHLHREHTDAFLVLEGGLTLRLHDDSLILSGGTLAVLPPGVVHGFDNDSDGLVRCFNIHTPSLGFAEYMRGRDLDFDQLDPPADGGLDPAKSVVVTRLSE